ncbi:MAG: hypothetical protein KatS3mg083_408 [Candidatus Dojkabacteria bacterium]|nr:MAG: hypothetical protein KatS3mg083_408 [Candidatus Dojkabacteria bacterium]GIW61937.1 MAG: hypothetical protein KatS3mg089_0789 [Patescibacteria group bacterium]
MDPNKNLNTLDPKLKEVYERVMGTSTPINSSPQTQQQQSSPPPSPAIPAQQPTIPHPPSSNAKTTPTLNDKPIINYAAITAKPSSDHSAPKIFKPSEPQTTSFGVVNTGNEKSKQEAVDTENKKSKIKMILLLILIPLFLIAYTFVWIIIFGVDVMSIISNK